MLFWIELAVNVLIWEFEHDKKGKNHFRSLPQVVECLMSATVGHQSVRTRIS